MLGYIFPKKYFSDGREMSAAEESRYWIARCRTCDTQTSIAARGGTRYRARGKKLQMLDCQTCTSQRIHEITWQPPSET